MSGPLHQYPSFLPARLHGRQTHARAVRYHLDERVLLNGSKTGMFGAW
jgi:formyltetrahydrofolate hydrolase